MTPAWKLFTCTVGLVAVPGPRGVNVMACEWSYVVNKDPLLVAVVLGPRTASRPLIEDAGAFAITFCAEDQAELADFAGSCSVTEVDKATSDALTLRPGRHTPWVAGGVLAVECRLRQIVPLPVHTMYVAEVLAEHRSTPAPRPLVKHGGMHRLGEPVGRTAVVAATRRLDSGRVRVVATGPGEGPWRVDGADAGPGDARGRLVADVPVAEGARQVRVERDGARPGTAAVTG
ncbi:hypothetical protein Asp14428_17620 [Actinoplanes sp. NBRC 14428]|uniref:Flavin reductase (DIM6/NTAB) family NADH-FMN oxidoreductase RutF n=1 Tax=Pseudosporangium ferrugineum TaxID=439699 RepID=A0A2T0SBD3_9ACTN|nr:flavin reductase family protein [Pseudosporangium ferrugineum]PRY30734.1 flavin reductase (DIM6/NTAB) family NADH-FMN oxidoreductase RutF [Pseudosporangium ferrugineum]BCJ50287.1 hypothetical protein Asp14428_17620 [Actinoplanes sp. NBRC 14428]